MPYHIGNAVHWETTQDLPPVFTFFVPMAETSDQWGGGILVWFEVKHLGQLDFFLCERETNHIENATLQT